MHRQERVIFICSLSLSGLFFSNDVLTDVLCWIKQYRNFGNSRKTNCKTIWNHPINRQMHCIFFLLKIDYYWRLQKHNVEIMHRIMCQLTIFFTGPKNACRIHTAHRLIFNKYSIMYFFSFLLLFGFCFVLKRIAVSN